MFHFRQWYPLLTGFNRRYLLPGIQKNHWKGQWIKPQLHFEEHLPEDYTATMCTSQLNMPHALLVFSHLNQLQIQSHMDTSDQQKLNCTWNSSCRGVFNFPALAVQEKSNFLIVLLIALLLAVFQTVPRTWNIHVGRRKEIGRDVEQANPRFLQQPLNRDITIRGLRL